jgi:hypothetical protein
MRDPAVRHEAGKGPVHGTVKRIDVRKKARERTEPGRLHAQLTMKKSMADRGTERGL